MWHNGGIGTDVVTEPITLGHETAGEIVEIGANVKGLEVGQRVAIEPGVPVSWIAAVKPRYVLTNSADSESKRREIDPKNAAVNTAKKANPTCATTSNTARSLLPTEVSRVKIRP